MRQPLLAPTRLFAGLPLCRRRSVRGVGLRMRASECDRYVRRCLADPTALDPTRCRRFALTLNAAAGLREFTDANLGRNFAKTGFG